MNVYEEIQKLYVETPNRDFAADLYYFLQCGYVFVTPTYAIIGKELDGGWFIHLAVGKGCMARFVSLMPYYLPKIGWARKDGEIVWRTTEKVIKLCKNH